jgi:hypothetical protein
MTSKTMHLGVFMKNTLSLHKKDHNASISIAFMFPKFVEALDGHSFFTATTADLIFVGVVPYILFSMHGCLSGLAKPILHKHLVHPIENNCR